MAACVRRVGLLVAVALLAASCGGGAEEPQVAAEEPTRSVAEAPTPTPEPTAEPPATPETPTPVEPSPTATPVTVDPDEWVDSVNQLISDRRYDGTLADIRYSLLQQDNGYFHITFDAIFWREFAATYATFADGLPEPPREFADLTEAFKQASLALAEHYAIAADDLDADAEAEALGNYELPREWDAYLDANAEADEAVALACFALRDAVTESGFGLINCIGAVIVNDIEWRTLEDCLLAQRLMPEQQCGDSADVDDGDATTVEPGESELAPGATYSFNTFGRPFALTIDEPTRVNVRESQVEIAPVDVDLWSMFWIMAVDELVDPETMTDNPNGRGTLIDMPDDFAGWVESLPFAVVSEGESTFGETTVPYWRLEAPAERDSPDAFEFYEFARNQGQLARSGVFWLVPHPDGPLIVYTFPFGDAPQGRTADEKFEYVETTLRTLALIPSS